MRILLVDDSATMRALIRSSLQEIGYAPFEILEASDGQQAVDLLRRENLEIDLILSDWEMPGMDGITFLRQVTAASPLREIPVIMVTSVSEQDNVVQALRQGAKDYIIKPFDTATLREKIGKLEGPIRERHAEDTTALLRTIVAAAPSGDAPFLDRLPPDLREALLAASETRRLDEGAVLVKPGETVDSLLLITDGEVSLEAEGGDPEVRGRGECVAELAFMSGAPARLRARARTRAEVRAVPRLRLGDLLRRHPILADSLAGLVLRRKPGRRIGSAPGDLSGRLSTLPFADVVQLVHSNQKTGTLELRSGPKLGGIYFEGGEARHAWTADLQGEAAFYDLMTWASANFTFQPDRRVAQRSLETPTLSLLMEGSRRLDEKGKRR